MSARPARDERWPPSAWFLNFDAEDELARGASLLARGAPLSGAAGYTPSRAQEARFEALRARLDGLLGPGDVVLTEAQCALKLPEYIGRAWCPTPRAQRALRAACALVAASPPLEVLIAVNHRAFHAELGQTLPGARFVRSFAGIQDVLAAPSSSGQWLLKRAFGYAGRGRLQVDPRRPGDVARAQTWILASLRSGGLQVEPLVRRRGDFAQHGYLPLAGEAVTGEPTVQICDDTGAWIRTKRATKSDISLAERAELRRHILLTAAALREAGYFGPFGIDAFRWETPSGSIELCARCEINARYSMGWALGMGERRPDLAPST